MNGLLFLTSDDFAIKNENVLCHEIPGICLVLFYSTFCEHCNSLIPIFNKLPGTFNGCQFAILNVSQNKTCVVLSQKTTTPIKYVPYIILYIDGKPYMSYKGPHGIEEIRNFILDVSRNLQQKQQFIMKKPVNTEPQKAIPAYTIGIPVSGDKNQLVCYLTMEEFMKKK